MLTPTTVYGDNVAAINEQKGWKAKLCPVATMSFANCRRSSSGGSSDVAPLVIYITPGTYAGQDWYLTSRRYIYVLGDPNTRPTLARDELSGPRKAMFYVANLNLSDTNIGMTGALAGYPNTMIVRNVYQCCETPRQQRHRQSQHRHRGGYVVGVLASVGIERHGRHGQHHAMRPTWRGARTRFFDVNNCAFWARGPVPRSRRRWTS